MLEANSARRFKKTTFKVEEENLSQQITKEWLQSNRLGAYSSSTISGCNTRRYHGLLVASANPPVDRISVLSTIMEQVVINGESYELATNEFEETFSPAGWDYLKKVKVGVDTTYVYKIGLTKIYKNILLSDQDNAVAVSYSIRGPFDKLILRPFTQLRDFHSLRKADSAVDIDIQSSENSVKILDSKSDISARLDSTKAKFSKDPQFWYNVKYRVDAQRGQDFSEDLFSPGVFQLEVTAGKKCEIIASLNAQNNISFDFDLIKLRKQSQLDKLANAVEQGDKTARRLAAMSSQFVVDRSVEGKLGASILAGFPWFADWGRDTFIALPGLLLETKQFDQAKLVFETYANHISQGMVPNRFDDYGGPAHYNSIDASLWFIIAAERFMQATDDQAFWENCLGPACEEIVTHYRKGTRFGIHADDDLLITGGDEETQLTWMDAKLDDQAFTSRHGKAVEINAMWYNANMILAKRNLGVVESADFYKNAADKIAKSFCKVFWNENWGWLNDCVKPDCSDASLRPNQIFAISLPYCPLPIDKARKVLYAVRSNLLTPVGLSTLSKHDPRYQGKYAGGHLARERAYHQGTVWAWLIGAFIEAYVKIEQADRNRSVRKQAKKWLAEFDNHIKQAGINSVSEIFDGDFPHTPRGCFAQAWSVAEVLRAKMIIARLKADEKNRQAQANQI